MCLKQSTKLATEDLGTKRKSGTPISLHLPLITNQPLILMGKTNKWSFDINRGFTSRASILSELQFGVDWLMYFEVEELHEVFDYWQHGSP
jgi:hypothetical protein